MNRGFLRVAVETTIAWPDKETVVDFEGRRITLTPETVSTYPTLLVELDRGFTKDAALKLLHEFATGLSWAEDAAVRLTLMTWGVPNAPFIGKGPNHGVIGMRKHLDYVPKSSDPKTQLTLALYREGMTVNLPHYRFLAFFRAINLHVPDGKAQIAWINGELPHLTATDAKKRLAELTPQCSDVGNYLYVQGRCAAAHASLTKPTINPDEPGDGIRLAEDLPIVRDLVRRLISHHFGIKTSWTVLREHLYELQGFSSRLEPKVLRSLKAREHVDPAAILLPPRISIRLRDEDRFEVFEDLTTAVAGVENGVVQVRGTSKDNLVTACLLLDFPEERLYFDPYGYVNIVDDGSAAAAILELSRLRYWRGWWPANGEVEVWTESERLGRADPAIAVNCMFSPEGYDRDLKAIIAEVERRGGKDQVCGIQGP